MRASEVPRGVAAGKACAAALDLSVDDAVVVHNSNRLAVRLLPCEVLARVAPAEAQAGSEFEVLLARRLAQTDSPMAELEPRVEPRVYCVMTLLSRYGPTTRPCRLETSRPASMPRR